MSYTPTNWQTGDIITAEKLNNNEEGTENATPFIVTVDHTPLYSNDLYSYYGADCSFTELLTALRSDRLVILKVQYENESKYYPLTYFADAESPASMDINFDSYDFYAPDPDQNVTLYIKHRNLYLNTETLPEGVDYDGDCILEISVSEFSLVNANSGGGGGGDIQ